MITLFSGRQIFLGLDGSCATLLFNNPEALNALNRTMAEECLTATRLILERRDISLLVLRGAGRAFIAGGDLRALLADPCGEAAAIIDPMHACLLHWQSAPWLTVAVIQGAAAGAGLSVAAAADLVLATDRARFVYAYSDIVTTPDLGLSWSLTRRIGKARALEMALLGQTMDAADALASGLVDRLVSADRLEDELSKWRVALAARSSSLVRATCQLFNAAPERSFACQLDAERASFLACAAQPEFSGAVRRFLDR